MPTGFDDRRLLRRKTLAVGLAAVVAFLGCLCIDGYRDRIASLPEVFACYGLWFSQLAAQFSSPQDVLSASDLMALQPSYFSIMHQAGVTVLTAVGGALLALSGALYQSVFRNPIASPSMLGVSSGIQLGVIILVLLFGTSAASMGGWRYLLCYACALAMLVALFVLSRLTSGKGKPLNIVNMLVIGTLLSQLVGVVITYVTWYLFDDALWEVYNGINEMLTVDTSWYAFVALFVSAVVSIVPVYLLRFRLNCLSFDEADMRMLGVNARAMQLVALACGTVMIISAQISVGTVAMLSLVVPHVSRAFFGADFRKQFAGDVLIGVFLLLACRVILSFLPFVGSMLPIGTVVSVLVLPAFVWILAMQQRSWE